jgi:hypothetical protein
MNNPKCSNCNWSHPDTCKACNAEQKVLVMVVNKGGIKR